MVARLMGLTPHARQGIESIKKGRSVNSAPLRSINGLFYCRVKNSMPEKLIRGVDVEVPPK